MKIVLKYFTRRIARGFNHSGLCTRMLSRSKIPNDPVDGEEEDNNNKQKTTSNVCSWLLWLFLVRLHNLQKKTNWICDKFDRGIRKFLKRKRERARNWFSIFNWISLLVTCVGHKNPVLLFFFSSNDYYRLWQRVKQSKLSMHLPPNTRDNNNNDILFMIKLMTC